MNFESKTMTLNEKSGVKYLTYNSLSAIPFINHAFSTRIGGVSEKEFASMNLSFGRGDSDENVTENYKIFCNAAGFEYKTLTASAQDHHTFVRKVTVKDCGVGIYKPRDMQSVDALMTNEPNVTLVTYYADCTPLFFVDKSKKVIALAHAGWRGTAGEIGKKTVEAMISAYGCQAKDIIAAIGPTISKCCYEVDESCADEFKKLDYLDKNKILFKKSDGKYMLDLIETNKEILINCGINEENIFLSDICTHCNSDLLWSHRATGGKRGGMCAFMCIKEV